MKLQKLIRPTLFLALVLTMATACRSKMPDTSILYIQHGSSFGMCRGYCIRTVAFDSQKVVHTRISRDTVAYPLRSDTAQLGSAKWQQLSGSIDPKAFFALPETIGCPDCADGGAEWIEIKYNNKVHRVTFEYGKIPDPTLETLLTELRKEQPAN